MTITTRQEMIDFRQTVKGDVGIIPTMGALHKGHQSLIEQSIKENHHTIVSIFVNPTQFNKVEDLEKYPRNIKRDLYFLSNINPKVIAFIPETPKEIYPSELASESFDLGSLENSMEGTFRPGHFQGVATVVTKLFSIISPTKAYFGEKDFQQTAVVKKAIEQVGQNIDIVSCPIVREDTGLAFSSRNERLSEKARMEQAPVIYKMLSSAKNALTAGVSAQEIRNHILNEFKTYPFLDVEYLEIVNQNNLMPIKKVSNEVTPRIFVAANLEGVRLIDNL